MHRIIEWFTRNSVAANLLMVAILASGLYSAFNRVILQEFPDFPSRTVVVAVPYRGSTPTEVEESIVTRLEEALFNVEGLKEMVGVATSSAGTVTLDIEEGYDLTKVYNDVKNRVDTIRTFPLEADRPQVALSSFEERVITIVLSGDLSETDMKHLGERVRDEVSTLPDVTLATLKATRPYEIAIEVSESNLLQYGITFDAIVRAVRAHSVDLSAGSIKTEGGNILLRTSEQAYTQPDFEKIVVLTRDDGTRVTLADVAMVIDSFDETPIIAKFNGKRAVAVDVFRTGKQSAIDIGAKVKRFIADAQEGFPPGISISYWQDDSERIVQRLDTLTFSALTGFCLVLIVLSLFLRPTLAFWVACGIPIAFAGAFIILPMLGVTINIISLFAFILVLGIVVDDAIVTGENVFQHMQRGENSLTASIRGTQEVSIPVVFGVLTTIAAFYPLVTLTGFRGNFYKQIPLVVITVLLFSLLESKLILPAHLKHCTSLGKGIAKRTLLVRFQRFFAEGLETVILKYYRPILEVCLNFRYATAAAFTGVLSIFIALIVGGYLLFVSFPRIPRDTIQITLVMPTGTTFERTEGYINRIESAALELKRETNEKFGETVIANVFATAGGRPFGGGRPGSSNPVGIAEQGEVVLELVPPENLKTRFTTREAVMELRDRVGPIPEAEQLNYSFTRGSGGALSIQLRGPSLDNLVKVSRELQKKMATYEGLFDIEDSFERATEEFELKLKPQASLLGVTAQNLAQQVRQAFFGAEAQRLQRGRDDVRVMVRYPESERKSVASLYAMMIRLQDGTEVPFEEVAEIEPSKSLPSIRRVDRNRIISVNADADQEAVDVDAIQADLADNYLPQLLSNYPSVRFSLEGRAAESRDNNRELLLGIAFALIVIYVLLAVPFRSYTQPIIVMLAIPFGIVGAILGHWIMSFIAVTFDRLNPAENISMMSILGMLALSGVVVNDSLVMVDFINQRRKEGMPLSEAVRLAGVRRFRPILLTSLTTFAGLLPLMFDNSQQAQFLIPMAISLGWGVLFATFITLLLVPVTCLIFDDIGRFFRWLYDRKESVEEEEVELAETYK